MSRHNHTELAIAPIVVDNSIYMAALRAYPSARFHSVLVDRILSETDEESLLFDGDQMLLDANQA